MAEIRRIERVELHELWIKEPKFTLWLQENIDILNDILNLNLSNAETEQSAGDFRVDIVAEDESGHSVIIENQLEKSDHDHLGKIITYLSVFEAKAAIWIVSHPRTEHINAITWLNESTAASFYLLKLEAIKIADSEPAPLLTLIVGPSEETKEVGRMKKDLAEQDLLRYKFFDGLLTFAKEKTKIHVNVSPTKYNWVSTSIGIDGLLLIYKIKKNATEVRLEIYKGRDTEKENKEIFYKLYESKDQIEREFGDTLEWSCVEGRIVCAIFKEIPDGGYGDPEDTWPGIYSKMVDTMIRLEKALRPHIKNS